MTAAKLQPDPADHPADFTVPIRIVEDARPRLLLADDDAGVRESLGKLLRNAGYQVTLAAHGGQVLEMVLNTHFDLLLLDLNMPHIDGWSTLDHLHSFKPSLPVIVITAQPNQRDWMREAGARVLMEKPLDLPLLLDTVRELVQEPHRPGEETEPARRFRHLAARSGETEFSQRLRRWGINE
jgi:CheY-like chemotaxis protein